MNDFVAIDFETANQHRTSICAVGAVKVRDGVVTDTFYSLIHPVPDFYFNHLTENVHGISKADTADAPTFEKIWPEFSRWLENLPLVAHNAAFDGSCLRAILRHYGLTDTIADRPFLCTLQAARKSIPRQLCATFTLPHLSSFLGIPFTDHHNALSDAKACAQIAIVLL